MDNPVRLPAPALACGCPACKRRLLADYARMIRANYTDEELLDVLELTRTSIVATLEERTRAYTMTEY